MTRIRGAPRMALWLPEAEGFLSPPKEGLGFDPAGAWEHAYVVLDNVPPLSPQAPARGIPPHPTDRAPPTPITATFSLSFRFRPRNRVGAAKTPTAAPVSVFVDRRRVHPWRARLGNRSVR